MLMDVIVWSILMRQNQCKHSWRVSLSTRLFPDIPEGPGKEQLWVMHILV